MTHFPPYDKRPFVQISGDPRDCSLGWVEILTALDAHQDARRIVIECYPGVSLEPLRQHLVAALGVEYVLYADDAMLPPAAIEAKAASCLGSDPVFGRMEPRALRDFFDEQKLAHAAAQALAVSGRVAAIGTGATMLLPDCDLLLYVDVARWEIQRRQRLGRMANLGLRNAAIALLVHGQIHVGVGNRSLRLDALDLGNRHLRVEVWVFAIALKGSAPLRQEQRSRASRGSGLFRNAPLKPDESELIHRTGVVFLFGLRSALNRHLPTQKLRD